MRLLHRLSDILSANLNELIERYEDPELLLKQAVREMDVSLRTALESAVKVVAHEKLLARQLSEEESAATGWRGRAEAAVQRGDDEVAREALRHKRDREAASAILAAQLAEVTVAGQALRRQIESMRRRATDAERKLTLLSARQRAAEARQRLLREFSLLPIGDQAFAKFERLCRKVERTEAQADALTELSWDSQAAELAVTFPGPEELAIEAELAAMKAHATN